MNVIAVRLRDIVFFLLLLSFLPDCGMHCRFSHTLSVTQYLFILCLVRWRGMVVPSVYRAGHVCRNVWTVAALCSSWLKSAEPLTTAMSVNKVGRSYSWRGYYLQVCAACPTTRLIRNGSNPVHPGNSNHDTFPTRTWPDAIMQVDTTQRPRLLQSTCLIHN
jgi:hypothetical protein